MTNLGTVNKISFDSRLTGPTPTVLPVNLLVNRGAANPLPLSTPTIQVIGGPGFNILSNDGTGIGFALNMTGGAGPDLLYNEAPGLPSIRFVTGGSPDRGTWAFPVGDILHNLGDDVSSITYDAPLDSSPDWLLNAGARVGAVTMNGGYGFNLLDNFGESASNLRLAGAVLPPGATLNPVTILPGATPSYGDLPAQANLFSSRGASATGLTLTGGHGVTSFEAFASGVRNVVVTSGDAASQLVVSPTAMGMNNLSFTGSQYDDYVSLQASDLSGLNLSLGSGNDYFESRGANLSNGVLDLGEGANVFRSLAAGLTGLTVNAGSGDDFFETQGVGANNLRLNAGAGNDFYRNYSVGASGIVFDAGVGDDFGVNFAQNVGSFSMLGADGNDSLFNYGDGAASITLDGGIGDDRLESLAKTVGALTLIGGLGNDRLYSARARVTSAKLDGGDGYDDLDLEGGSVGTVDFNGGIGNDSVRVAAEVTTSLTVQGGAGNDSLDLQRVVIGASITASIDLGDNDDVAILGGAISAVGAAIPPVTVNAGSGNDRFVVLPTLTGKLNLVGGSGDDTYYLTDAAASVVIDERLQAPTDTSSDTLDFSGFRTGSINLDLQLTTAQPQGPLTVQLTDAQGIENVIGTQGADTILGNARNNALSGASFFSTTPTTPVAQTGVQYVFVDFDTFTNSATENAGLPRENQITDEHVYTTDERIQIIDIINRNYRGSTDVLSANPNFNLIATRNLSDIPATIRQAGNYVTVNVNQLPQTLQPGGEATEIDVGNRHLGGVARVQVSGMLGGEFTPAATVENYVKLTGKIATHEIGHLMGLWHADSVGPIGFGGHLPLSPTLGNPGFSDAPAAFETFSHLLSSPASVGSDRFGDLGDLYFSEREALKLTVGFTPSASTTEANIPVGSLVPLTSLATPNTVGQNAFNSVKQFRGNAKLIDGAIDLNPSTGKSRADTFKVRLEKGQTLNLEALSTAIATSDPTTDPNGFLAETVNTHLRLFNASGALVAENADSFEAPDAIIRDFVVPTTGDYTIEVSAETYIGAPPSGTDPFYLAGFSGNDIGNYRLYISTFESANRTNGTDVIDGRGGANSTNGIQFAAQANATINEGATFARNVTFTDQGGQSWSGTINYGDGTSTAFNNITVSSIPLSRVYADNGAYTVTVNLTNNNGAKASVSFVVNVLNVAPTVTGPTGPASGAIGASVTFSASATDPAGAADPLVFTWQVTSGPASIPFTVVAGSNGRQIQFSPTIVGPYVVQVTVDDGDGGVVTRTANFSATGVGPSYSIQPGPANVPGNSLVITGTNDNDILIIAPALNSQLQTIPNQYVLATATSMNSTGRITLATINATVTSIQIYGLAGNDGIIDLVNLPSFIFGGVGDDSIKGGPNRNVIVGGDGKDVIFGGQNRDVIIGGLGADTLYGDTDLLFGTGGDDILIAGSTAFDGNLAALDAIMAEWASASNYTVRTNNLRSAATAAVSRKNGNHFLNASTIFDDNNADVLWGLGGTDWFLLNLNSGEDISRRDVAKDKAAAERLDDLG